MTKYNKILFLLLLFFLIFVYIGIAKPNIPWSTSSVAEQFTAQENKIAMYVITMKREDRLQNIKEQETKIDRQITLVDAVKGNDLNEAELLKSGLLSQNYQGQGGDVGKREWGCYMSHFKIYEEIKSKQQESDYSIIFEDDFSITTDNFISKVNGAVELIKLKNVEFDMLYLGNTNDNHGEQVDENIYHVLQETPLWGTHAIVINNKNIDKIIGETNHINMAIDEKLKVLSMYNKLNILVLYPCIVIQNDSASEIR